MSREVKIDRGLRDVALSERHRLWGWDCPAIDIDFLLIEYSYGKAVALIEYKHENAILKDFNSTNYKALIDLGDRAKLPVFCVQYKADFSEWTAIPLNTFAEDCLPENTIMTEGEYVHFLLNVLRNSQEHKCLDNRF